MPGTVKRMQIFPSQGHRSQVDATRLGPRPIAFKLESLRIYTCKRPIIDNIVSHGKSCSIFSTAPAVPIACTTSPCSKFGGVILQYAMHKTVRAGEPILFRSSWRRSRTSHAINGEPFAGRHRSEKNCRRIFDSGLVDREAALIYGRAPIGECENGT